MNGEDYRQGRRSCESAVVDVVSAPPIDWTCRGCDERRPCLPATWTPQSTFTR